MSSKKDYIIFIITITMMSMMGLLASDIYIPALSKLSLALQAKPSDIQMTLGIYLIGLSLFQLFYGPLSDHYGRKPILLLGFSIYTAASVGCVFAHTIDQLIVVRFLQAIGACAGLVVGRAIIADVFQGEETIKVYNIVYPLVAASPAIAPFIGGYLTSWIGWRATFGFVALFGMALMIMTIRFLQETNRKKGEGSALIKVFSDAPKILKHPGYLSYIVCICAIYGAWFTYLAQATFLFAHMGYQPSQIGYFYFPLAIAIYFGNFLCKLFVPRYGITRIFHWGQGFFIAGNLLFLLISYTFSATNPIEIIAPMTVIAVANGIILPLGIPSAVALFPEKSGSASGIVGFFQIGFSALCASFIGRWFGISEISLASVLVALSLISLFLYVCFTAATLRAS